MITPIPALSDNYIWLYQGNNLVIIVDPGQAKPVIDYLEDHQLKPDVILLTHKHEDHTGGVNDLKDRYPNIEVYGPQETAVWNTQTVEPGQTFTIGDVKLTVALTGGHTAGHISYLTDKFLFCGDALFLAGCGRVFTGDYFAQFQALQWFKNLDPGIKVYAGHEYSKTNLAFAQTVFQEDEAYQTKVGQLLKKVEANLSQGEPSLPSTIGQELEVNPFIKAESLEEFKSLRDLRDKF